MATTSIDDVTVQLEELYKCMKKAEVNYKKCPKERLSVGYVKVRMQNIDEYWASFKQAHTVLLQITTSEHRKTLVYFTENYYDQCEEKYLNLKTTFQDLLDFNTPAPAMTSMNSSLGAGEIRSFMDVKLPRIDLPKFSGSYEEWQAFEDIFTSLIHNNKSLSDVQRFHYLKSCLVGEASTTLKHYQVVEKNYKPAWDTLKKRYSHKRLVVNAILKRLFSSKKMFTQSASQLKVLIDNMKECLHGFKGMSINTESWDPILIFLATQRLDPESHKQWEDHVSLQCAGDLPTLEDFFQFLEDKVHTLELTSASSSSARPIKERSFHATATTDRACIYCQDTHALYHCKQFGRLNPADRSEYVKNEKLCYNCLLPGHSVQFCKQRVSCKICHRRHHSLLHQTNWKGASVREDNKTTEVSAHANIEEDKESQTEEEAPDEEIATNFAAKGSTALLATAIVPVRDEAGNINLLRALVDPGSQATFISERAAQLFTARRAPVKGTITGVGGTKATVSHAMELEVLSRSEDKFNLNVRMYIMPTRLTSLLPSKQIDFNERSNNWVHLKGITLADPTFDKPGRVDLLLGVEVCAQIMKEKIIKGPPGSPCAQLTSLGWILFGGIHSDSQDELITMHHHFDMDNMLKNMWELEPPFKRAYTENERLCEEMFETTHSRTDDGRYIVKLPMKNDQPEATQGDTRNIALKRFKQLEARFEKLPQLKQEYTKVIEEYIDMKHMEEIPVEERKCPSVYLPHHAVVKGDKETTKMRVVFDASAKGHNNKSLNDDLLVGPQLQEDLRNIIMRWRMKRVCFVADVEKMYRQILVTKSDANYQRLLWRTNPTEEIKDYRLLRLTFGTASAPYLAVKTLHQIAEDEGKNQVTAAQVIKEDFYMDDLISGNDSIEEAMNTARDIQNILQRGGFHLQKWSSNDRRFLEQIEPSHRSSRVNLEIKLDGTIQALGLAWNVGKDSFHYTFKLPAIPETITKRSILAQTQRLFDPLGWLAPAFLPAKILMQELWLQGVSWDQEVNDDIKQKWISLRQGFEHIGNVEIERWLHTSQRNLPMVTLHGFCDASNKAYGAVAYLRVETEDGNIKTRIVAAKTRVAPVKPVSLPRLELCGAVLLSRLLKQVKEAMRIPDAQVYAWTDSSVVLSWLFGYPGRWNVFVCNRVVEILDNIGNQRWYHVASEDNPADIASRGSTLQDLVHTAIWWDGPQWLQTNDIPYRRPEIKKTELERRQAIQVNLNIESKETGINFENFDTLPELLKTIVYCVRFLNSKGSPVNREGELTTMELEDALLRCIKITQDRDYTEELKSLRNNRYVKKNSEIKALNPYLDAKNVLRVGGRLRNSDLPEEQKHPIILSARNALTSLIIADAHKKTLHGTLPLMFSYIRSKYWIIRAKNAIKAHIHQCIICARQRAMTKIQVMGDLPKVRVTQARPFLHSGVDFAGPIQVLMSRGRGAKSNKAYIAIFICMAIKCIHLELVGDLSSESFIGAFKRFVARRGRCTHLWSDQGRNFIGANKELATAWKEAGLQLPGHLVNRLAEEGTQWHFIPPYSPNFGGLWEAGVKSVKFHLKRILTTNLTFEEMTTTLCEIEACLNSRPLTPLDPTDPDSDALTPGHFLIGEAPVTIPAPDLREINVNRLSRWQLTQKLVRDFWHRWQTEYLTRLQERPKWLRRTSEFDIGNIVLIKDDQLPPGQWSLGRIVNKHPGPDGATRVYSVRCRGIVTKRSVSKLCEMPVNTSID